MANILGLHFAHDGGVAIVVGNRLVCAISSERFTRIKKFYGFTDAVLDSALDMAGLTLNDIDLITFTDYFAEHNNGIARLYFGSNEIGVFSQQLFGNMTCKFVSFEIRGRRIPAIAIPHHAAHCASAFFTSRFDEAYCFSCDVCMGAPRCNSLVAFGKGNKLDSMYCPHLMVGVGYHSFTDRLGLGNALFKAGSTMGLAGYGRVLPIVEKDIKTFVEDCFHTVEDYDGCFRKMWKILAGTEEPFPKEKKDSREAMDIAASFQFIFEESILTAIKDIKNDASTNLCLSGGSLLNCNVNSRILRETQFKKIHLFPACGDDGMAVGSALYVAHHILNEPRPVYEDAAVCYLGKDHHPEEVEADYDYIARRISEGKLVGWINGRSEYGPRALGNRSILADPRNYHNRELLNFLIKKREWFRPFAPSVLEEKCQEWFEFDQKSPFMLFTAKIKNSKEIPAVSHIDGTSRMQTVNKETNPKFYNLIDAFYQQTNIPMVLNTSLNGPGEPILETEEDGLKFFKETPIDVMVLNGKIHEK